MCLLYRPPGAATAGALMVGAGPYELTPLKRECRRRCRERVRSGLRFGVYCFGSSIGLMTVLIAGRHEHPADVRDCRARPRPEAAAAASRRRRAVALLIVALGIAVAAI
jgi:hypothetical protein